jgi:hypothetical protein
MAAVGADRAVASQTCRAAAFGSLRSGRDITGAQRRRQTSSSVADAPKRTVGLRSEASR